MKINKDINVELVTIVVATAAIIISMFFSINSMRTDLDNKIEKMNANHRADISKMDDRWYELLQQFHHLDTYVQQFKDGQKR